MKDLLPTSKAAKRLGIKHETALKYIREGDLVAVALPSKSKFGVRYRVSPDEIADFIARRSTLPRRTTEPEISPGPVSIPASDPELLENHG